MTANQQVSKWWESVKNNPAPRLDEAYSGGFMSQEFLGTVKIDFVEMWSRRREVGFKKSRK